MLADVAEMLRSALPAINWQAKAESHLSALLCRGTVVSDGIGEPLKISLIAALTSHSVPFCAKAPLERFLASAAHEDSGVDMSMTPLLITRLLSRMSLPLLSSLK